MLTIELARARIAPGARVLDLGCGGGRHAFACAKAGAHVVALDADAAALVEVAAIFAAMRDGGEIAPGTEAVALGGDATCLPFPDESFDVVVASEVLEHLPDDAAGLAELARVLRPGGVLALSVPRAGPEALNWLLSSAYHEVEGGHVRIYRRSQLRARARAAGLVAHGSHHAHALHTPYWWLRCLVGVDRDDQALVAAYHRLLVYDIVRRPRSLRLVEAALNPLIGKSFVGYFGKPRPASPGPSPAAPAASIVRLAPRRPGPDRRPGSARAPFVPLAAGTGSRAELVETAGALVALQEPSGRIPWYEGGPCDPWNHLEAAMALGAAGFVGAAEAAIAWLADRQRADGAWHAGYGPGGIVSDARLDTNGTAYVASGLLHLSLVTGDRGLLEERRAMLEAAIRFVLAKQRPGGEIGWSEAPASSPEGLCLLAACSSIYSSLRAALRCAEALGCDWPEAAHGATRLQAAICHRPGAFAPKGEYAMDWYYPVLSGALTGVAASRRLERGWDRFVQPGRGVLCRSDRRWVTAAETAECALAFLQVGRRDEAAWLLSWTADQRLPGGGYPTGLVYPERSEFPPGERSSYTAAAFVLAADALDLEGAGAGEATRAVLVPNAPAVMAEESAG